MGRNSRSTLSIRAELGRVPDPAEQIRLASVKRRATREPRGGGRDVRREAAAVRPDASTTATTASSTRRPPLCFYPLEQQIQA
ncbi:hypothetical protein EJB05_11773, partial [Eragrostis curvula]